MEVGKDERTVLELAYRQGVAPPARFLNAPELLDGLQLFYMAFLELTSCRSLGYGAVGPIPWQSTDRYCERYGIEGEQKEDMYYFVAKMDEAYLGVQALKSKTKPGKKK